MHFRLCTLGRSVSTLSLILSVGCGGGSSTSTSSVSLCENIPGTSWIPEIPNSSISNHDLSHIQFSQKTTSLTGKLTGPDQPILTQNLVQVSVDMPSDLGPLGSLTWTAQITQIPNNYSGGVYPYLISLSDGTAEYVNLTNDCMVTGLYLYSPTLGFTLNSNCSIQSPSAFSSRAQWEDHQAGSMDSTLSVGVNTFPTCNWSDSSRSTYDTTSSSCGFTASGSNLFPIGSTHLRYGPGVTYTAKYALIADRHLNTSSGNIQIGLNLTTTKKINTNSSPGGAVDLNFFIVGTDNITASRTAKGQQSLNSLGAKVGEFLGQSNVNFQIGAVRSFELGCDTVTDHFKALNVDDIGRLFISSQGVLQSANQTAPALNIFLVNSIGESDSDDLTILGISGAIGGPSLSGTGSSGVVISTFNQLATLNPNCSVSTQVCTDPLTQDANFFDLSETISHELGHYLGLNHISEYHALTHDSVLDTPENLVTATYGGQSFLTIDSCRMDNSSVFWATNTTCAADCSSYSPTLGTFCSSARSCEFNYMMWWTTKNYHNGASDGTLFSAQEGTIMNYQPLAY